MNVHKCFIHKFTPRCGYNYIHPFPGRTTTAAGAQLFPPLIRRLGCRHPLGIKMLRRRRIATPPEISAKLARTTWPAFGARGTTGTPPWLCVGWRPCPGFHTAAKPSPHPPRSTERPAQCDARSRQHGAAACRLRRRRRRVAAHLLLLPVASPSGGALRTAAAAVVVVVGL